MADILNTPRCATSSNLNTGVPECFLDVKKPVMVILAKPSHRITAANRASLATFKSFLQTECLSGRMFPVPNLVMNSDNSEDVTKSTDAYGNMEITKDGAYNWSLFVKGGGTCFNAILRSFNSGGFWAYLVDSDMNFIGTLSGTDIRPATAIFYAPKWKLADGSNPTRYSVDLTLPRPEEINDAGKLAYVAGSDEAGVSIDYPTEIVGNLDVTLTQIANANNAFTVGAKLMCGGTNLYDLFADELAAAAAWSVVNSSTGAAISITGVTKDATNKGWIIAHASSDAAKITSAGAAAWAALTPTPVGGGGESGYDCNTITATLIHTT